MVRHIRQHNLLILSLFLLITVSLAASLQAAQPDDTATGVKHDSVTLKTTIPLTPEEKAWLSEHKILSVAGPKAFPPFHYYEKDGTVRGIASDYIRFIMELLGVQIDVQRNLPWPEVLRKARKKEIDVISCAAKAAEREEYLSFSNPYLTFPFVIVSRRDGPFISGIDDLNGIKVSLIKKVSTYEWLKRDKIDVIPYFVNTPLEALKAVSLGFSDAYIGNLAAISYLIEKNGLANLKIAAPTAYGNYNLYIGVRKDWPQLVSIINKTLGAMTPEQHAAIRNKLLPVRYEHGIRKADLLKWILGITGIAVLILMAILLWNRTLNREVRERKQAEEALRESEEKYRSMMESMVDPAYICSPDFRVEYVNAAMLKRIGGVALGKPCYKMIHDFDEKCTWCIHQEIQQGNKCSMEIISPKDMHTYSISYSPIHHVDGTVSNLAIYRDITEIRNMEQQLQETQKMEAIATLAGGIAHEFNNALMGVMGNIELLKWDFPEDKRRAKYFDVMNESGHRMSRLTDQLLAYAEGGQYEPRDLKLDDFIIETLPILQHDLNPEVRVKTRFQENISYIRADHTQMQMVLSAILANSNEAIEDEGLIKIIAENKDVDEDFTKQHPGLKPGVYVCLTIEDTGKGMDEETKTGIFEPFFTTKFQGRGMGMAAVYGIIKSHDGAITVDSKPGKGTVVRIYLPAVETKEKAKAVKQPKSEIAMGEGTILVIEDEKPLLDLFRQTLERLGYRVLLAGTGKEAVEFAKTFDGQIDLALLDIKLPDIDGGSLYPLIMEARPDLKTIVCSGYSIDGPAQAILDAGAEGFIQKPFSIAPFAEKLKEVLEGK